MVLSARYCSRRRWTSDVSKTLLRTMRSTWARISSTSTGIIRQHFNTVSNPVTHRSGVPANPLFLTRILDLDVQYCQTSQRGVYEITPTFGDPRVGRRMPAAGAGIPVYDDRKNLRSVRVGRSRRESHRRQDRHQYQVSDRGRPGGLLYPSAVAARSLGAFR